MSSFVNHASFASPDTNWGDTNFGLPGNTQEARQVQLSLKIYR
jgi:hypothetical protein